MKRKNDWLGKSSHEGQIEVNLGQADRSTKAMLNIRWKVNWGVRRCVERVRGLWVRCYGKGKDKRSV